MHTLQKRDFLNFNDKDQDISYLNNLDFSHLRQSFSCISFHIHKKNLSRGHGEDRES